MYQPGDPRLVGRSLLIEQGRVRLSFGQDLDCRQVQWPRRDTTWGALFEESFRRIPAGAHGAPARPKNFGLKTPRKQPVAVYSLCPPVGAPAPLDEGQWVIASPTGDLLFREDPQYLLRLVPRDNEARPSPASFECIKARTSTQKAICMSFDLASWDRSVERALDDFVETRPERKAEVERSQIAYLKRRDSCGMDVDCVEQEEMSRVGELIQLKAQ